MKFVLLIKQGFNPAIEKHGLQAGARKFPRRSSAVLPLHVFERPLFKSSPLDKGHSGHADDRKAAVTMDTYCETSFC